MFDAGAILPLALVAGAIEWLVGLMLVSAPLGSRFKGRGFALMHGSFGPMAFIAGLGVIAAFLATFNAAIQLDLATIMSLGDNVVQQMTSFQDCNVLLTVRIGGAVFIIVLLLDIIKIILSGGSLAAVSVLDAMQAGATQANNVASVLAPTSTIYGLVVLIQFLLVDFMQVMASAWEMFVGLGAVLYVLPLAVARRAGKFVAVFGLLGFAFIPFFLEVANLFQSWLHVSGYDVYTICSISGGWQIPTNIYNFAPVYSAFMYLTVPALYFGFMGWAASALGGAPLFQRMTRLVPANPLSGFRQSASLASVAVGEAISRVAFEGKVKLAKTAIERLEQRIAKRSGLIEQALSQAQSAFSVAQVGALSESPVAQNASYMATARLAQLHQVLEKNDELLKLLREAKEKHLSLGRMFRRKPHSAAAAHRSAYGDLEWLEKMLKNAAALERELDVFMVGVIDMNPEGINELQQLDLEVTHDFPEPSLGEAKEDEVWLDGERAMIAKADELERDVETLRGKTLQEANVDNPVVQGLLAGVKADGEKIRSLHNQLEELYDRHKKDYDEAKADKKEWGLNVSSVREFGEAAQQLGYWARTAKEQIKHARQFSHLYIPDALQDHVIGEEHWDLIDVGAQRAAEELSKTEETKREVAAQSGAPPAAEEPIKFPDLLPSPLQKKEEERAKEAEEAKRREVKKRPRKSKGDGEPQIQQTAQEEDPYYQLLLQWEAMERADNEMEEKLNKSGEGRRSEGEHKDSEKKDSKND